ncbi:MAG: AAA family ATPase [Elusimicrobia bacterium]|nr:AAA family ATPase [Elusimicrobiota bacterium]
MTAAREHFDRLERLLEIEREAEKEENRKNLERLPPAMREALGKTVTRLVVEREDVGVGGHPLLVLSRAQGAEELSPFHAMDRGDNVLLHFPGAAEKDSVDGVLYEVEDYRVSVALNRPAPDPLPAGKCRLDLLGSDATFQRMKRALALVRDARAGTLAELRDIRLGLARPPGAEPLPEPTLFDAGLNEFQAQAVRRALAAPRFAVVHGPPGTGKTTVLAEIIRQEVNRGRRVLATAPSNIAVDNILEKLVATGLRVVRLGHPARTLEALRHATLSAQVADHPEQKEIAELKSWRESLARQSQRRRGTREEEHARQAEIRRLWKQTRDLENDLSRRILAGAQVVLATHAGLPKSLRGRFDVAVLDEASQATEPLSWVPLAVADKAVFAGDPMQLPPTLYSPLAAKEGLAVTLFEELQKALPDSAQTLLRVQYRMHRTLMGFSSERFYDGRLIAHESVSSHLACQLPEVRITDLTDAPLTYVDTAGAGFEEAWNEMLESRENAKEAELAVTLAEALLASGLRPRELALITPYVAQARRLKGMMRASGVEVGSVDGFQGREKEAVIVSLVRSNEKGEIGFLGDTRRMNVALTRARRLLIVLGDSATIGRHPFYSAFLEYAEKRGRYRSAWEWM